MHHYVLTDMISIIIGASLSEPHIYVKYGVFVCLYVCIISVAHLAVYFYFIVRIPGFTDCEYEVLDNCDTPQGQEAIANWPAGRADAAANTRVGKGSETESSA